jgi:anti-sigma regulatory factor (Ser/Thr protein kinase)
MAPPRKINNTSKRGRAKQKEQSKAAVAGSARQRQRSLSGVDEAYNNIEKRSSCNRNPEQDARALGATQSSSFGLEERSLCVLQRECMRSKDKQRMVLQDMRICTAFVGAVWEIVSNALDAVEKRGANTIKVTLEPSSNSVTVEDDGFGFPLEHVFRNNGNNTPDKPLPEAMLTEWHISDNFKLSTDGESCMSANTERVMSGNNGVGIKLVNKYAEHLELATDNGTCLYKQAFKHGEKLAEPQWGTSTGTKAQK